jgi:hypothetical protein
LNSLLHEDDPQVVVIYSSAPMPRFRRSPRMPPGRTGRSRMREVGMRPMASGASNVAELLGLFREEAVL